MKRVPALCLISGVLFGLSAMVACEEAYDDGTTETPTTTPETVPPVEDTTDDYTDDTTTVPPVTPPEQEEQTSYTGTLTRTTDEAGATLWMLTGTAEGDIEVDVAGVEADATALEGMRVVVTGPLTEGTDAQGATTRVVTVETIERAE